MGFEVKYAKVCTLDNQTNSKKVFTILFPPIFGEADIRVHEYIHLESQHFTWNNGGYFIPNFNFRGLKSIHPSTYNNTEAEEKTNSNSSNNININYTEKTLPDFPTYQLSWNNVSFFNKKITFSSPYSEQGGLGRSINWEHCSKDFEHIKDAISKSIPFVIAEIKNGNITNILNLDEIRNSIITLMKKTNNAQPIKINKPKTDILKKPIRLQLSEIKKRHEVKSSEYIKYLCSIHLCEYPVFYCIETKNTTSSNSSPEKAFIFIIRIFDDKMLIIYENILSSRSSYLFTIKKSGFIGAIHKIHKFFASDIDNKRENMAQHNIDFVSNKIYSYCRVIHNSYQQWICDIAKIINRPL